jgi:hypothetical protein
MLGLYKNKSNTIKGAEYLAQLSNFHLLEKDGYME